VKAYAKSKAEEVRATAGLADATARATPAQAVVDTTTKAVTAAEAEVERIVKVYDKATAGSSD
jgi:hypothetical protein